MIPVANAGEMEFVMKVNNYYEYYITSKFGVQSKLVCYDLKALKTVF